MYLRDLCGITKEGVSFLDLSYGAEKIGLHTLSIKASLDDLRKKVSLPCIIHWQGNHFITVYKVTKNKVFVSDPAKDLIAYSHQEFINGWYGEKQDQGVLMCLEPRADFLSRSSENGKPGARGIRTMANYFLRYKSSLLNIFIVMFIATLLQGLLPFISKAVIDVGIHSQDIDFINLVLIANIAIVLSVTVSNAIRNWLLMHISTRVNVSLISDYLIKLMKLPVSFFENTMIGDIMQRVQDHDRIRGFIMNNSINVLFSFFTFIVFSIIFLYFNLSIFTIIRCL